MSVLTTTQLDQLARMVSQSLGLAFPQQRWADLERGLVAAAGELGHSDPSAFVTELLAAGVSPRWAATLAVHLTVGETYFFRDPDAFRALETSILPQLIRARAAAGLPVRIWSAGCCTGEEAYSLAIAASRCAAGLKHARIEVLGTDVNPRFLAHAVRGEYREWSFRTTEAGIRQHYFTQTSSRAYSVVSSLRKLVRFASLNLADPVYPCAASGTADVDILFCRNVLIYLSPEQARNVAGRLARCLSDEGVLLVAPTELSGELFRDLSVHRIDGTTFYQRRRSVAATAWRAPVATAPVLPSAWPPPTPRPAAPVRPPADDSDASEQYAAQAQACADRGELAESLRWCDVALRADRLNPALHYLRGIVQQTRGELVEATASLRRAIYLDPQFVMAYVSLAHLTQQRGRRREATQALRQARGLLCEYPVDMPVPQASGLTAGRLVQILDAIHSSEVRV